MAVNMLQKRYRRARELNIQLVDMDVNTMAGYYLENYPKAPIEALWNDVNNLRVPFTVASAARVEIIAALAAQRYRKEGVQNVFRKGQNYNLSK